MPPMISMNRLTKWYGRRLAIADVSFEVMAGEVMGLLGPNGSGKTTVLRILAGYLRPSSGTAEVAGVDVVDDPMAARQRVGYVPEEAPLYESMRVREFLTFMAQIKGLRDGRVYEAVDAISERLGLESVGHLLIGKLSRGFRQRVAVAHALLNRPPVLILDEPTNGLDPHQIIEMRDLIRSLAGTHTVLVTSHILAEVSRVVERVAILLRGRVLTVESLRAEAGRRRVRLRVRGDELRVLACLHAVPGVDAVAVERHSEDPDIRIYSVDTSSGPGAAEDLAAAVFHHGLRLVELTETTVDLEKRFLDLTQPRPEEMQ